MVRAKVRCEGINGGVNGNEVNFSTVYETDAEKSPEDVSFTKSTPWGSIKMGIDNPAALSQFEAGKYYYVDFSPVS